MYRDFCGDSCSRLIQHKTDHDRQLNAAARQKGATRVRSAALSNAKGTKGASSNIRLTSWKEKIRNKGGKSRDRDREASLPGHYLKDNF